MKGIIMSYKDLFKTKIPQSNDNTEDQNNAPKLVGPSTPKVKPKETKNKD